MCGSLEDFLFNVFFQENQMTVSVTGATGFIGRKLVQRLRAGKKIHFFFSDDVFEHL